MRDIEAKEIEMKEPNEFSQVHDVPKDYVDVQYTYPPILNWEGIGRFTIYIACFVAMFYIVKTAIGFL